MTFKKHPELARATTGVWPSHPALVRQLFRRWVPVMSPDSSHSPHEISKIQSNHPSPPPPSYTFPKPCYEQAFVKQVVIVGSLRHKALPQGAGAIPSKQNKKKFVS
jgi:hypothetical protein